MHTGPRSRTQRAQLLLQTLDVSCSQETQSTPRTGPPLPMACQAGQAVSMLGYCDRLLVHDAPQPWACMLQISFWASLYCPRQHWQSVISVPTAPAFLVCWCPVPLTPFRSHDPWTCLRAARHSLTLGPGLPSRGWIRMPGELLVGAATHVTPAMHSSVCSEERFWRPLHVHVLRRPGMPCDREAQAQACALLQLLLLQRSIVSPSRPRMSRLPSQEQLRACPPKLSAHAHMPF